MWTAEQLARLAKLADEFLDLPSEGREDWLRRMRLQHADLTTALDAMTAGSTGRTSRHPSPMLAGPLEGDERLPGMGEVVGPYRLLSPLGQGGMSEVWLADQIDGRVKRQVAVKLIAPHLTNAGWRLRFERERDILASLSHPGIARLIDAGFTAQGQAYLVMGLIDGETILQYATRHATPTRQCVEMIVSLLEAVAYAHLRAVVHRDIKPSNVMVSQQGHVLLLDFGVAKLLQPDAADASAPDAQLTARYGQAMTLDYASPEQVAGQPVGAASDVYSVGVLLFELLAGRRPYMLGRSSRAALEEAILEQALLPPSQCVAAAWAQRLGLSAPELALQLQGGLDAVVLKALQRQPSERYDSATAFTQDLRRWLQGQVAEAPAVNLPQRVPSLNAAATAPTAAEDPPGPGKRIRDQIREHLIPTNTVIGLGLAAVTLADICAPALLPLAVGLRNVTAVFGLCLVAAALWPGAVDRLLIRVGLMTPNAGAAGVPTWRRRIFSTSLMVPVIFVAVALTATVSMANSGGVIASQVPSLRSLQRQILGLQQDVTTISRNVDKANLTLEALAAREQAVEAQMAASPLSLGLLELHGAGAPSPADGPWPARLAVYLNADGHSFKQLELHLVTQGEDGHLRLQNLSHLLGTAAGPGAVQLMTSLPQGTRAMAACLFLPKAADGSQPMLIHRWRAATTPDGIVPQAEGAAELRRGVAPTCAV